MRPGEKGMWWQLPTIFVLKLQRLCLFRKAAGVENVAIPGRTAPTPEPVPQRSAAAAGPAASVEQMVEGVVAPACDIERVCHPVCVRAAERGGQAEVDEFVTASAAGELAVKNP